MKSDHCSWLRCVGIAVLFAVHGMSVVSSASAACYNTPNVAVDALMTSSSVAAALKDGYQVTKIELDSVLGRRWATIASCSHPEWPVFALPAPEGRPVAEAPATQHFLTDNARATLLVRAGDVVRMWRQEKLLRIEFAGVSEENGGLGKTIRVRLLRRNIDDQSIPEQFSGVIRGPLDVELQP
jgi:hypothetical protein